MAHTLRRQASFLLANAQRSPAASGFARQPTRSLSASAARHENIEEANKWRKITIAGYIFCTTFGIYTFATEEHHSSHDKPEYPYLRIRNKEFPWGPDGLFESKQHH